MENKIVANGLTQDEPLLWEKGKKGKTGFSLPKRDVETFSVDSDLKGVGPDFPDLSEVDVVRHYTRLSQWNFGLDAGIYPLGSCTMKYNPKTNERQASIPGFSGSHPLLPVEFSQGALEIIYELEKSLCEITGMDAVSLQPAAGAHGELAGMLIFHAYHESRNSKRSKILIPDTAHGTNPASASLCGYKSIPVKSNSDGILTPEVIREVMDEDTAGIMITNPNTLGLFEENIKEIAEIVHSKGGLVYADGANMNAVMGIVQMGKIGVDVMHLNLHKTFSTPHGGGGPGSGPVCVTKNLEKFLPLPRVIKESDKFVFVDENSDSIGRLHAFYGNFSVLIKAYSYILSMGGDGLKKVSLHAVLNANYIKEKLRDDFFIPYDRPCMHECIINDKKQEENKITTLDMAKRIMDYGIHPPTIYFPLVVQGAMMIEPTESESKEDIDVLIETFKIIAREAEKSPEILKESPRFAKRRRLDETVAARKPVLTG